jgi:steroid delta-isomerase-like uncharacterized protein
MARTETANGEVEETTAEVKPQRKRISKRKAVEGHVRSYFDAMARRDAEAMREHWREDGVEDVVPVGVLRGRDEIHSFFSATFAAMPDVETTLTRLVAGDSSAAVEWRMSGHFTGAPFQGIEPTGKRVEVRGLDLFELEDGKLVSNTAYYDGMSFARQIGMLPPEGSGAERAMTGAFNAVTKLRRKVADQRGS